MTLSDEQIAALTGDERRALIWRLARPVADVIPRHYDAYPGERRVALMTLGAAVLVPWTAYLGVSMPNRYVARHWTLTWVGFDVVLIVMFGSTAVLGLLRRQLVVVAAFSSGVLLLCDAWFGITTANAHDRPVSIATAVLAEVPIAVLLMTSALRLIRITVRRVFAIGPTEPLAGAAPILDLDSTVPPA